MRYLYDGHTGSLYSSDRQLPYEETYCETCGDYDHLLGKFETPEDWWNLIKDSCDINGSGGWSLQYIFPMFASEFDLKLFIEYKDYNEQSQGFCCNSDENILQQINEIISNK